MKGYGNIVEREILNHRKRSILTILVILLGVSSLVFFNEIDILNRKYDMNLVNYEEGNKHFILRNINRSKLESLEKNSLIDKLGVSSEEIVIVEKDIENKETVEKEEKVFYADERYLNNILIKDYYGLKGRFPLNENEALILDKDILKVEIGSKIRVDGIERTVVGIVEDKIKKDNIKDRILLGLSRKNNKKIFAHVRLKSNKNIVKVAEQIGEIVGINEKMQWHGSGQEIEAIKEKETLDLNVRKINLYNQKVKLKNMEYKRNDVNSILVSLLGITLIFLIYVAINASVKEKKKMYSMLKCMGASNGQIRNLILKESLILSIVSIVPGIILGEIIFLMLKDKLIYIFGNIDFNITHTLNLKAISIVVIGSILICVLSTLKPMIWITRLSPIDGIRDENILSRKRRIRSKFIRKILGYEGELAYKNLRGSKGSFLGLTLIMVLILIVFNVFTSYYVYQIKSVEASFGVLEKDIEVGGLSDEVVEVLEDAKAYGDYSRYIDIENLFKITGIDEAVLKDSKSFLYFDKEKKEVVPKTQGLITVINDKCFNDLAPYIEGKKITLEKFKKDGAILFSNKERGALNPIEKENKIKLQLTDLKDEIFEFEGEDTVLRNKEVFTPKEVEELDLNLFGTIYFETLLGPMTEYQWEFIGLIISENTAKKLTKKYNTMGNGIANFEFKTPEFRDKYVSILEGRLKENIKEDVYMNFINNSYENRKENIDFINTFASVMYTILGYILVMMIICLINVRDIILNARKKEFGIMFAVGMDKKMLRKCLIYEGVIQGGIALILGNAISIGILQIIKMNEMKFVYPKWILILGSIVIIGVSAVNTLNSIRRLSSDKAVEMIRNIE